MKKISPRGTAAIVLVLSAWLALSPGAARAQSSINAKLKEQLSIQENIYRSQGGDRPQGYVIDRSLFSYADTLPPEFGRELGRLGPDDRWLDIGTGQGRAILDYYTPERDMTEAEERAWRDRRAKAVGISIEDRRTPRWRVMVESLEPGKARYLAGKRLRQYSQDELGRFQVISDVGGGFSYTHHLSEFMEKALGLLVMNGQFFTVLQNVHCEDGSNKPRYAGSPFLTEIDKVDGSKVKVCAWLKSISCVEVQCLRKTDWDPPIEVYRVQKVCDNVRVPPLVAVHYLANTPPERRFQLVELPLSPAADGTVPAK